MTVKSYQLPSIMEPMQPLLGAETAVLCVQNGLPWWYFHAHGGPQDGRRLSKLDPGGTVWDTIRSRTGLGGVIYAACDRLAPGVVFIETAKPSLHIGAPDGRRSPVVLGLAAAMNGGALHVDVPADIRTVIWSKLQMNTCSACSAAWATPVLAICTATRL